MGYKNMLSHMHDKVSSLGLQEQAWMQYEGTRNSLQSTLNLSGLLCCTYLKVTPNSHWRHPKNCTLCSNERSWGPQRPEICLLEGSFHVREYKNVGWKVSGWSPAGSALLSGLNGMGPPVTLFTWSPTHSYSPALHTILPLHK